MLKEFFEHSDSLSDLNTDLPLKEKLARVHDVIKENLPFIARISVAIFDPETRVLKTFIDSSDKETPLANYEALLDESFTLRQMVEKRAPRVINNLFKLAEGKQKHSRKILKAGYAASYTLPMYQHGNFFGFLFFNAKETEVFDKAALNQLDIFGHMLSLMIMSELSMVKILTAAMKTTGSITHVRDPETGSHLDRMSRYTRLIAKELAEKYQLSDDYIEHVFMFSPLHDIGKIGIPDQILMKSGKLDEDEMTVMKTHTSIGRGIIDQVIKNFGLGTMNNIDIVRNIAEFHHETLNGKGYPLGMKGEDIPLEAKIVAVADIFDALTSERPYKSAWSNEKAFAKIKEMAGEQIDKDCVTALLNNVDKVEEIQRTFKEKNYFG